MGKRNYRKFVERALRIMADLSAVMMFFAFLAFAVSGVKFATTGAVGENVLSVVSIIPPQSETGTWRVVADLAGGDVITGTITPADVTESQASPKATTSKDISIRVEAVDEVAKYDVINRAKSISKYDGFAVAEPVGYVGTFACPSLDVPLLVNRTWHIVLPLKIKVGLDRNAHVCVYRIQYGLKGDFALKSIAWDAKMIVTVGSESSTAWISSDTIPSVRLGAFGTAKWFGSLVTGNQPPSTANAVAYWSLSKKTWTPNLLDNYNDYAMKANDVNSKLDSMTSEIILLKCEAPFGYTGDKIEYARSCSDEYVKKLFASANLAAKEMEQSIPFWTTGTFYADKLSESYLNVKADARLTVQQVTFELYASKVGYITFHGMPDIVRIEPLTFRSGDPAFLNVLVRNVGNATGYFTASYEGEKFSMIYNAPMQSIVVGGEKYLSIGIRGPPLVEGKIIETGKVRVWDVEHPPYSDNDSAVVIMDARTAEGEIAEEEVGIEMREPSPCLFEGHQQLFEQQDDSVKIMECVGGDYTRLVDTCRSMAAVEYVGKGKYRCKVTPVPEPDTPPPSTALYVDTEERTAYWMSPGGTEVAWSVSATGSKMRGAEMEMGDELRSINKLWLKILSTKSYSSKTNGDRDGFSYKRLWRLSVSADGDFEVYLDGEKIRGATSASYSYTSSTAIVVVSVLALIMLAGGYRFYTLTKGVRKAASAGRR